MNRREALKCIGALPVVAPQVMASLTEGVRARWFMVNDSVISFIGEVRDYRWGTSAASLLFAKRYGIVRKAGDLTP